MGYATCSPNHASVVYAMHGQTALLAHLEGQLRVADFEVVGVAQWVESRRRITKSELPRAV